MTTSQIKQHLAQFRARLLAHEHQAELAIEHAYQQIMASIEPRLTNLYQQIEHAQASGDKVPVSWLYEQQRLSVLKQFLQGQIDHFAMLAHTTTLQGQHTGVMLGQEAAHSLLQASRPPGVRWTFGVPSQEALSNMIGVTQAGSPLADLFAGFGQKAADDAGSVLITAIANGDNPRTIASRLAQALDEPRQRALVIARDQMNRVYRSAQQANYQANSDVVDSMIRICDFGPRTCGPCIALSGTVYALDDDPGFHTCDRCSLVPQTKSWSDILSPLGIDTSGIEETSYQPVNGSDWFDQQSESVQQQILGPGKYQAWKEGQFTLSDLVAHEDDPKWGPSIREKSLKELTRR